MKKEYIISGIIALCISLGVILLSPEIIPGLKTLKIEHISSTPAKGAIYTVNNENEFVPLDFTAVAEQVMDAVVHIKSTQAIAQASPGTQPYRQLPDPFRDFFGDMFGPQFRFETPQQPIPYPNIGSGSGVIINSEGYIITNNHVIAGASDIEVTLNDNRSYKAKVIGTDPSTDLALLQIKEKDLPTLPLVNSDDVRVGEWVLAIGNPLNLNSTVTAGIVSAKSRNINILQDQYAVESFIQTDAAINPGNSGGALVNLQGGLIGINTAIASPTGTYAGYGFAVPSNLVSKVVEDLLKHGMVQRGYLGVTIRGVDGSLAREKGLEVTRGVYVDSVSENSAAEEAGIKTGDVIQEINGFKVNTAPQLLEMIARHSPGDVLKLKLNRSGREKELEVKLRNRDGETRYMAKNKEEILNILGADFEAVDAATAKRLNIEGGVKVSKLFTGKLMQQTEIKEGFIITKVNGQTINSVEQLANMLQNLEGGVLLEGLYEDVPGMYYYAFGI